MERALKREGLIMIICAGTESECRLSSPNSWLPIADKCGPTTIVGMFSSTSE